MRINHYNVPSGERSLHKQRDALAGAARADTTAFTAALAAEGPASFAFDKRRGEQVRLYTAISNSGNVQLVSLFSNAHQRNKVGSMNVAPRRDTLRILTIESLDWSRYKGVGAAMLDIADRIRDSAGLSSLSLISQDEGASEFFYKKGFRFTEEGRNAESHFRFTVRSRRRRHPYRRYGAPGLGYSGGSTGQPALPGWHFIRSSDCNREAAAGMRPFSALRVCT